MSRFNLIKTINTYCNVYWNILKPLVGVICVKNRIFVFVIIILLSLPGIRADGKEQGGGEVLDLLMLAEGEVDLEPKSYDVIIYGTVSKVDSQSINGSLVYNIEIIIEKNIYLREWLVKIISGKKIIKTFDVNKRKIGEKLLVMIDVIHVQDDKLKFPAYRNSSCSFGVILNQEEYYGEHFDNAQLLGELEDLVNGDTIDSDFYEAFAIFCPKCIADYFLEVTCGDDSESSPQWLYFP